MIKQDVRRIGIIGAGVAGLATAKTLLAEGYDCTVFERAPRVGGVWADGYVNFGVQVQKELYEFPDWPLPEEAPNFTPGPIISGNRMNCGSSRMLSAMNCAPNTWV